MKTKTKVLLGLGVLVIVVAFVVLSSNQQLFQGSAFKKFSFKSKSTILSVPISRTSGNNTAQYSQSVFARANISYVSTIALDSTRFVVVYKDGGNSNSGTAIIGIVNGTTITYGIPVVFSSGDVSSISVAALDSTHFVVAYNGRSDDRAIIGTVNGTTITYGIPVVFESGIVHYGTNISVAALDSTHFVVAYLRGEVQANHWGTAIVGAVSGTNITYGRPVLFDIHGAYSVSAITLDPTHFIIAYSRGGASSNFGTAVVGTLNGTTITYGTSVIFKNTIQASSVSVATFGSTGFVVTYLHRESPSGIAVAGTINGTNITYSIPMAFTSVWTNSASTTTLDSTRFIVAYSDNGEHGYGPFYGDVVISAVSR